MQEQKEDHRIVAKSTPTAMNLAVTVSTSSSSVNSPTASKSLGILKGSSQKNGCSGTPDTRRKINSNLNAASSSQGWQKDALLDGPCCDRKRPGTPELSWDLRYRVIYRTWIPRISGRPRNPKKFRRLGNRWQILATSFPYITRLCTSHEQGLLDRRTSFWSKSYRWTERPRCEHSYLSLFKLLQFILGKITRKIWDLPRINLWSLWNSSFKWLRGWSRIRRITGLTTIDWQQPMWRETTLCWITWISRCVPADIFFQTESRVSCPRELRKVRQKKVRQWRNRDRWIWCQGTSWAQRKLLRKSREQPGESRVESELCFTYRRVRWQCDLFVCRRCQFTSKSVLCLTTPPRPTVSAAKEREKMRPQVASTSEVTMTATLGGLAVSEQRRWTRWDQRRRLNPTLHRALPPTRQEKRQSLWPHVTIHLCRAPVAAAPTKVFEEWILRPMSGNSFSPPVRFFFFRLVSSGSIHMPACCTSHVVQGQRPACDALIQTCDGRCQIHPSGLRDRRAPVKSDAASKSQL